MTPGDKQTLRIALLGCGSVGSQVARLLREQAGDLAVRTGARLELAGIAVRRPAYPRDAGIDRDLLTADAMELATRPDIDIVVEVIGGIEPARSLLLAAMKAGKSVVTANKALLAENGAEVHGAAREHGTDLYYEAAVAGAIPLLRPLRESLAGDAVAACSALSTARPTTSWTGWTPQVRASPKPWRRPSRWATPRPIPPRTSRDSTPRPRRRSWPAWPSTRR